MSSSSSSSSSSVGTRSGDTKQKESQKRERDSDETPNGKRQRVVSALCALLAHKMFAATHFWPCFSLNEQIQLACLCKDIFKDSGLPSGRLDCKFDIQMFRGSQELRLNRLSGPSMVIEWIPKEFTSKLDIKLVLLCHYKHGLHCVIPEPVLGVTSLEVIGKQIYHRYSFEANVFPCLTTLVLSNTNITDRTLKSLLNCFPTVTTLDISDNQYVKDFNLLALLPELKTIDISNTSMIPYNCATMAELIMNFRRDIFVEQPILIERIKWSQMSGYALILDVLLMFPFLCGFDVSNSCMFLPSDLEKLTACPTLRELNISGCEALIQDDLANVLPKFEGLTKLTAGNTYINDEAIRGLSDYKKPTGDESVTPLLLGDCDEKKLQLATHTSDPCMDTGDDTSSSPIQHLGLPWCEHVTGKSLKYIECMPNLMSLDIRWTEINADEAFEYIRANPQVKVDYCFTYLALSGRKDVSNKDMSYIRCMPELDYLDITGTSITLAVALGYKIAHPHVEVIYEFGDDE